MRSIALIIFATAPFALPALKAQQSTSPSSQVADNHSDLTNDPDFKRLPAEKQAQVLQTLARIDKEREEARQQLAKEKEVPEFHLRAVVQPGTEIDHYPFPATTSIDSVALNDSGDFAFIARWPLSDGTQFSGIFTSRRIVVTEGNEIEDKVIVSIPKGAAIAIDGAGHAAFEAEYANDEIELMGNIRRMGIFIDQQFALALPDGAKHRDFALTDDGFVVPQNQFTPTDRPFPFFRRNQHGQFLMPVNLSPLGFLLLFVSPN